MKMAWTENVRLKAGRRGGLEFFTVTCEVHFSPIDKRLGIDYFIRGVVFERDGDLDQAVMRYWGNGLTIDRQSTQGGDSFDDFIAWLERDEGSQWLDPESDDGKVITLTKRLDVGDQERNDEEYVALVLLRPDFGDVHVVSNTVEINLG
jgi:hypothetical protein